MEYRDFILIDYTAILARYDAGELDEATTVRHLRIDVTRAMEVLRSTRYFGVYETYSTSFQDIITDLVTRYQLKLPADTQAAAEAILNRHLSLQRLKKLRLLLGD